MTPFNLPPTAARVTRGIVAAATVAGTLTAATLPAFADPCVLGPDGKFHCAGGNVGGGGGGNGGGGGGGGGGNGDGGFNIPPLLPGDEEELGLGGDPGGGGDGGGGPAPIPTLTLAQMARANAQLPTPIVHTAPAGKTYVGVRTNLWVDNYVDVGTEPITVGRQTIRAWATATTVTWKMVEKQFDCAGPGSRNSAECSYTYQRSSANQRGGKYYIVATITWTFRWECQGLDCQSSGDTLPSMTRDSAPTPLLVGEIQTNARD